MPAIRNNLGMSLLNRASCRSVQVAQAINMLADQTTAEQRPSVSALRPTLCLQILWRSMNWRCMAAFHFWFNFRRDAVTATRADLVLPQSCNRCPMSKASALDSFRREMAQLDHASHLSIILSHTYSHLNTHTHTTGEEPTQQKGELERQ
jgi:hypothetical protein